MPSLLTVIVQYVQKKYLCIDDKHWYGFQELNEVILVNHLHYLDTDFLKKTKMNRFVS